MLKVIYDPKQKKFIGAEGAEIFQPQYVFGNKWNCRIRHDGLVQCTATDGRDGKYYECCFKISPTGLVTFSVMKEGKRELKHYRIKEYPFVGVIMLTEQKNVEERIAYYR